MPVAGDWDGDGRDSIGVFDPGTAGWYLKNTASLGAPDLATSVRLARVAAVEAVTPMALRAATAEPEDEPAAYLTQDAPAAIVAADAVPAPPSRRTRRRHFARLGAAAGIRLRRRSKG